MSYILDALRKSDQQRRLGGVQSLTYSPAPAMVPERSAMLSHGLLGASLAIAIGMAIVWLRPAPPEPVMIVASAASPLAVIPRQAVIAPLPVVPAKVEPVPPRHEPTATVAPAPVLAAPSPGSRISVAARNETRKPPPRAVAPGPGGAGAMSNQKAMTSADLPTSIRKTLPVMSVAVHAYSATAQDRLVSINGRMLREGDTLAPDLRLEQITPDGMIFTYRGYRFRRGAH